MDKRNRRTEFIDKKNDRGDLKLPMKSNDDRMKRNEIMYPKIINPDGDKRKINTNLSPEFKINITLKQATCQPNAVNSKSSNSEGEKIFTSKRNNVKDIQNQNKTALELKRIREKYTMKFRNPTKPECTFKKKEGPIDKLKTEIMKSPFENIKNESKEPQPNLPHIGQNTSQKQQGKKVVIKTITNKNGSTRTYKAVTFEEKKIKPSTLDIKIPDDTFNKANSIKSSDANSLKGKPTISKINIKEKSLASKKIAKKSDRKYRNYSSRDHTVQDARRSPSTEVAKWAPASITTDTKPYYEAWVDTTLTAISKMDRLKFEKKAIMRYLEALERPDTPELYYSNCADEKYTGKIKIRHQK